LPTGIDDEAKHHGFARHSGASRSGEPGIHFTARFAVRWIPGSMLRIAPE